MKIFLGDKNMLIFIYRLNTKIRLTMLCFSGFELYSRWVPLHNEELMAKKMVSRVLAELYL